MARRQRAKKSGRNGRAGGQRRARATQVLAQGVGATPPKAFGESRNGHGGRHSLQCWDAKMPQHLPLPRAVGPYTVIRATKRFQSDADCLLFGPFQATSPTSPQDAKWVSTICVAGVNSGLPISDPNNATRYNIPLGALGEAAHLTPSAFTVQIMNPQALQTTSGMVYGGVMPVKAAIGGRTQTWAQAFDNFVEFQNPRLMSAGKLALRGVQSSSYPLNMTEVSKFTTYQQFVDGPFTYSASQEEVAGWAPIFVFNTNAVALEFLVTVEYRVRFDFSHPAASSHKHHPVASDSLWNRMLASASSLGHGMLDIADVVANVGNVVRRAEPALAALA